MIRKLRGKLFAFLRKKADAEVAINLSGLVLLTGVPGAGKTLRMVEYMEAALRAGRPCFAYNIDGLKLPGVIPWEDPHKWRELPERAVLFVDEAQRAFRARRGMVDVPESITAMETIRHDGVCIVMTTQQPGYLDKHIRGLVGHHEHLVEIVPGLMSNVYTFRSTREEVTPASLKDASYQAWAHPKRLHGAYKSASVHTKVVRMSLRAKLLALATLATVAFVAYAFTPHKQATSHGAAQAPSGAGALPRGSGKPARPAQAVYASAAEYIDAFTPRIEAMPWTAPAFDGRAVVADPRAYCVLAAAGVDAQGKHRGESCTCLTEQGTRYAMSLEQCRILATIGEPYNPYKAPDRGGDVAAGVTSTARPGPVVDEGPKAL